MTTQNISSSSNFNAEVEPVSGGGLANVVRALPSAVIVRANFTRQANTSPAYAANQVVNGVASAGAGALLQFVGVGPANSVVEIVEMQCITSDEASQQQLRMYWFDANFPTVTVATALADKSPFFIEDADEAHSFGYIDMQVFSRQDATAHTSGSAISRDLFYHTIKTDGNGDAWALCINQTATYTPLSAQTYKFCGTFKRI